jgi:hypothetical protein
MKKKVLLKFIFLFTLILGCKNNSDIVKIKKDYISLKLPDTLKLGEYNKGEFKTLIFLDDSLKTNASDDKLGFIYVGIFGNNEEIQKKKCDTFVTYSKSAKDTLTIPFYVKPEKEGSLNFSTIIDIERYLTSYKYKDTSKTRTIVLTYNFTKPVYVIDSNTQKEVIHNK